MPANDSVQDEIVNLPGSVHVVACPGSGKTRVLTDRVERGIYELPSHQHRVVAVTYTNRAADEMRSRLLKRGIDLKRVWIGTIHSFASEWIVKRYACYIPALQKGYSLASESTMRRLEIEAKQQFNLSLYENIPLQRLRDGTWAINPPQLIADARDRYKELLAESSLIDFDDLLWYAYSVLTRYPSIPDCLGKMIATLCVDESQDTQDLQYAILGSITATNPESVELFIVGDHNQAIYTELGGVVLSTAQCQAEFGLGHLEPRSLHYNYRSTDRLVAYARLLLDENEEIESRASWAAEQGMICFHRFACQNSDLPEYVGSLVRHHLAEGVPANEICVLAPQWRQVRYLGRRLAATLPDVEFDAAGMSPFPRQQDDFWYQVTRLVFSRPDARMYQVRLKWAADILKRFENYYGTTKQTENITPRCLLSFVNSFVSDCEDALEYLANFVDNLLEHLGLSWDMCAVARTLWDDYMEASQERLHDLGIEAMSQTDRVRRLFQERTGVNVSTSHSVKGEEYEVVICTGLLHGYIPHWGVIFNGEIDETESARKLLYVIITRAKKKLHLIAEDGHVTRSGKPYQVCHLLDALEFNYDPMPMT